MMIIDIQENLGIKQIFESAGHFIVFFFEYATCLTVKILISIQAAIESVVALNKCKVICNYAGRNRYS